MSYTLIQPSDCLNTSRIYLNNNWSTFDSRLNALTFDYANTTNSLNNLNNYFLNTHSIIQKRIAIFNNSLISGSQNSTIGTNISLSITRKKTNTKMLIELTGGRYFYNSQKGMYTHFFGSTNLNSTETNLFGGPIEQVTFDSGSGTYIQGYHNAKALYTPASNVSTLNVRVYVEKIVADSTVNEFWNYFVSGDPKTSVPIVLTITEIA